MTTSGALILNRPLKYNVVHRYNFTVLAKVSPTAGMEGWGLGSGLGSGVWVWGWGQGLGSGSGLGSGFWVGGGVNVGSLYIILRIKMD